MLGGERTLSTIKYIRYSELNLLIQENVLEDDVKNSWYGISTSHCIRKRIV